MLTFPGVMDLSLASVKSFAHLFQCNKDIPVGPLFHYYFFCHHVNQCFTTYSHNICQAGLSVSLELKVNLQVPGSREPGSNLVH